MPDPWQKEVKEISIHAPLRGRPRKPQRSWGCPRFQSTPPCGGDGRLPPVYPGRPDFNPRPLAGATQAPESPEALSGISIHAPLRGRLGDGSPDCQHHDFNPRPLAGATLTVFLCSEIRPHFNPRPLAGATAGEHPVGVSPFDFNPRPLAGATAVRPRISPGAGISIHAPLRGRLTTEMPLRHIKHFNPRPPCGGDGKKD